MVHGIAFATLMDFFGEWEDPQVVQNTTSSVIVINMFIFYFHSYPHVS